MPIRFIYLIGSLLASTLLLSSLYLQAYHSMAPCLLCLLQRSILGLIAILFCLGACLAHRLARQVVAAITSLVATAGIILASRQLWLQHFPSPASDNGTCSASLAYLLKVLSLREIMVHIFYGEGETCLQQGQPILFFSLTQWALLCFLLFLGITLYLVIKEVNS